LIFRVIVSMDAESNIRQFREFLLLYNSISEKCFNLCITNFNKREINLDETTCVDTCIRKQVSINHKVMSVFAEVQPIYMQRRMDEMTKKQEELVEQMQQMQQTEQSE